jgi:hypothetical protein
MQETTTNLNLNLFYPFTTWKAFYSSVQLIRQTGPMSVLLTDCKNKGLCLGLSQILEVDPHISCRADSLILCQKLYPIPIGT